MTKETTSAFTIAKVPDITDIHGHFMPAAATTDLDRIDPSGTQLPRLIIESSDSGVILHNGEFFRRVRRSCWDIEARLEELNDQRVSIQVISPVPVAIDYGLDPILGLEMARLQNDAIAEAARESSGRLVGLGTVPLQSPDLGIAELERVVVELGLAGIEIGTRVGTHELDMSTLRPIYETAADLDARIFVHPLEGGGTLSRSQSPLTAFGLGMPTETAFAACAMVFGGVLDQLPDLQVCLAHGGGSFAWCYPRLRFRALRGVDPETADYQRAHFDELVRTLFVDSLVFDPFNLKLAVERFGSNRVIFGSDCPFVPWDLDGQPDLIDAAYSRGDLTVSEGQSIRSTNGSEFLMPTGNRAQTTR